MIKPKCLNMGISTRKRLEFVDITQKINEFIRDCEIRDGVVLVFTRHTTSGLADSSHRGKASILALMPLILNVATFIRAPQIAWISYPKYAARYQVSWP